ncbi:hypothetical protein AGMMS50230_02030 [Spirochaetia bacterium]|nr:hypothetical protein AGMMS50230_02030 [Spirochaetia bacterium]
MSYDKLMKVFYGLALFYLISCTRQSSFIDEYINTIDKTIPDTYIFENDKYSKRIEINNKSQDEIFIDIIVGENNIVQSCYITIVFFDLISPRKYYKQLSKCLDNGNWQFIENIDKYKRQNGELYSKNGIYVGTYEPVYYTISIGISKNKENFQRDGFCD